MNVEVVSTHQLPVWRERFGVAETPAEYVFHRPRLYLETTIPSYLTARPSRDLNTARLQRITTRWWNSWRTQFDIYVSSLVIEEAERGDPEAAKRRLVFLERFPLLMLNTHSRTLQMRLMESCALPPSAQADAGHVALASVHKIDFLLTWNCAHLVNPQTASKITQVCHSYRFSCPELCTPQQLMERHENVRATK